MNCIFVYTGSVTANPCGGTLSAGFWHHAPDGRVCAQRARGKCRGAADLTGELLSHNHLLHTNQLFMTNTMLPLSLQMGDGELDSYQVSLNLCSNLNAGIVLKLISLEEGFMCRKCLSA